ncbi:MAG: hypothetical protein IKY66_06980 [Bacteroidales bacterium]|nr:hypothetical protein [Bacteroidales bacterium]
MATKKKKSEVAVETVVEDKVINVKGDESPRFTLEQLVMSNRYKKYAYILETKLKVDEKYTLAEVDKLIRDMI